MPSVKSKNKSFMFDKIKYVCFDSKNAFIEMPKHSFAATCGDGFWSGEQRQVRIKRLEIGYLVYTPADRRTYFGELRAYFNKSDWNVDKHGLIYTDRAWLEDFRSLLQNIGFSEAAAKDVDYSEQGMQGDFYVSLDIGGKFATEFALIKCFGNQMDDHGRIV